MKMHLSFLGALCVASFASAAPVVYTDTHGDQVGSTNRARDIWSVSIDNDNTNLYITINLDPLANFATANFNYGVGITTGAGAGGDTSANAVTHGNAYNRNISIDSSLGGMTDWIGIFGAGGAGNAGSPFTSFGFNDYVFGTPTAVAPAVAGAWTKINTVASGQPISTQGGNPGPSSVTVTVPMIDFTANLNLSAGTTIYFDVYSTGTGAGQTAYDSLASASPTNGTNSATTQYNGSVLLSYTIQVPEPATLSSVGLGGIAMMRRARRIG